MRSRTPMHLSASELASSIISSHHWLTVDLCSSIGPSRESNWVEVLLQRTITRIICRFPWLQEYIPHEGIQLVRKSCSIMTAEGVRLVEQKKRQVEDEGIESLDDGKDVFTLLSEQIFSLIPSLTANI